MTRHDYRLVCRRTDAVPPRVVSTKTLRNVTPAGALQRAHDWPAALRRALGLDADVPLRVRVERLGGPASDERVA